MDEAKTIRRQTTERILITSLPDTLKGIITDSLEKFELSSSGPKLPKDLSTGRRHTIHVYYTSPVNDITDESKFLLKPRSESYAEPRRAGGSPIREAYSEMEKRQAHFPALKQGAQLTLKPSAGKKIKTLTRLNSCPDGGERKGTLRTSPEDWIWVKNGGNQASPLVLSAKSTFPEIKSTLRDRRRHSLPVSTENMADLLSMSLVASESFKEAGCVLHTKASNSLPQGTRAKLINLKLNQSDETEYQRTKLSTKNMGSFQAEGKTEGPERSNKVHAMRTHVKKADDGFNEMETRVARLFEWLQDQTDNDELR